MSRRQEETPKTHTTSAIANCQLPITDLFSLADIQINSKALLPIGNN